MNKIVLINKYLKVVKQGRPILYKILIHNGWIPQKRWWQTIIINMFVLTWNITLVLNHTKPNNI